MTPNSRYNIHNHCMDNLYSELKCNNIFRTHKPLIWPRGYILPTGFTWISCLKHSQYNILQRTIPSTLSSRTGYSGGSKIIK